MRQQRAEVGHRPDAEEDDQREDAGLDAERVDETEDAGGASDPRKRDVDEDAGEPDGKKQCGLVLLLDREPNEEPADEDHEELSPREVDDPRRVEQLLEAGEDIHRSYRIRATIWPAAI